MKSWHDLSELAGDAVGIAETNGFETALEEGLVQGTPEFAAKEADIVLSTINFVLDCPGDYGVEGLTESDIRDIRQYLAERYN